jgi:hypothetical protein
MGASHGFDFLATGGASPTRAFSIKQGRAGILIPATTMPVLLGNFRSKSVSPLNS